MYGSAGNGVVRTFAVAVVPATAGSLEKNDVNLLHESSGGPSSLFLSAHLLPLDLAFFFICVAAGFRPAPGRHPPLQPFFPTMLQ